MKLLFIVLNIIQVVCGSKYYILSLDSGQYSGLLTSEFVSFMEKKSYLIARRLFCIEQRTSKRIAMYELFDMMAGSETGAIIAATLVVPNDDPNNKLENKHWSTKSSSFFKENVDILYQESNMPESIKSILSLVFLVLVGVVAFKTAGFYFRKENSSSVKL